jgi:hypothetical protein
MSIRYARGRAARCTAADDEHINRHALRTVRFIR